MMKIKKMHKRIILGLSVLALFSTVPARAAEETKWCNEKEPSEGDVNQRYGISLVHNGGNNFTLKMNPPSNKEERCKMKFNVSEINSKGVTVEQQLSCDADLPLYIEERSDDTAYGLPGVIVKVTSTDKMIKNEKETGSCYYAGGSVTLEMTVPIEAKKTSSSCPEVQREDPTLTVPAIDCANQNYEAGTFEYKFCYAKSHAGTNSYDFTGKGGKYSDDSKKLPTFKCNYDISSGQVPLEPEKLTGDNYFVNKSYIYGKNIEKVTKGKYEYYYSPGYKTEGSAVTCEVTCEEAVEVEYGPPVASKAGMCFTYKVRVTSRTSCNMSKAPELPRLDCDYCTPTPNCVGSSGKVWQQGGPSEEFDQCVKSCDGGKYTKKCSNKCYKQVYGKASKTSATLYDDVLATRLVADTYTGSLKDCLELNTGGCYDRTNGNIEWHAGSTPIRGGEGRWYSENPGGRYHNGTFILDSRGFWRRQYEDGSICQDTCVWSGCGGDQYLNANMAAKDYERNIAKYNAAIKTCKSKAVCSTTTSEYTISADYTPMGKNEVTITFPYETKKDTIKHTSSTVISTADKKDTTLLPNYPEEGEGLLGCYKKGEDGSINPNVQNLYRSTWSFPGTWINGKTGEISFLPKSSTDVSWREYKNKFCIPADADQVNERWWNEFYYYKMKKQASEQGTKYTVFDETKVADKCETTTKDTIVQPQKTKEEELVWNIHANAVKFGYFEWNIEMACFYALNPKPTTPTEQQTSKSGEKKSCDPEPDNYRVRSIDLENVFPATTGEVTNTKAEPAAVGRTPGFNWSEFATNTKNEKYVSKPNNLIKSIQTVGYGVYSDDYLDYEFELTPQTIRDMRKDGGTTNRSGTNYTNFDESGFYVDENGVSRYKSKKIRSLAGNNTIPNNDSTIACNNMKNAKSTECYVVEG